jgi:predicted RND superfamily exporter protein
MKYHRIARITLAVITILSLGAVGVGTQLKFDYDFESFFPVDDPELEFYNTFRSYFESDNDFVLIGIENDKGIFRSDFLQRVDSLSKDLVGIEDVRFLQSPTLASQFIIGPLGPIEVPYLHPEDPSKYKADSVRIYKSSSLVGTLFSTDAKSVSILVETTPFLSKVKSDSLVKELDNVIERYRFDEIHLAGRLHGQKYFVDKMQWELATFTALGIILLIIFLTISFRSWWGVWVPLVVVLLAVTWLLALMVLFGKPLDIMSILLPTILFVVGMSDVVHIITRYLEELRNGESQVEAIKISFKHIGMATFLTSLTTAIGFLTLLTANIMPVQDFGLYTAIGVFVAFLLAFTLLPAILLLNPKPKTAHQPNEILFWNKQMHSGFLWMLKNRKLVLVLGVVLIVGSLISISTIKVDNYLLEDLAEDDPHRADFEFFEDHYAGVRPFDMAIWTPDSSSLLQYQVIQQLDTLERYLMEHYQIGFIASPVTFVRMTNQALNGGNPDSYAVPKTEAEFRRIERFYQKVKKRPEFKTFISDDLAFGRISAKITDYGGHKMKQLNEQMLEETAQFIDPSIVQFRLTGMALLIDLNNESLASNMMFGLLIAFGVIGLIMGILYRSSRMVVLTLIPNIVPLLMIGGFMGVMGYDLKVATSIIFTIAFGIAVDDTIHYMSKLKMELNKGKSLLYALKRTSISTGKAITVTSLILMSGFVTLILSTFASTYYIGLLVSLTLLFAVLSDLFLLPALIITFFKTGKQKNK